VDVRDQIRSTSLSDPLQGRYGPRSNQGTTCARCPKATWLPGQAQARGHVEIAEHSPGQPAALAGEEIRELTIRTGISRRNKFRFERSRASAGNPEHAARGQNEGPLTGPGDEKRRCSLACSARPSVASHPWFQRGTRSVLWANGRGVPSEVCNPEGFLWGRQRQGAFRAWPAFSPLSGRGASASGETDSSVSGGAERRDRGSARGRPLRFAGQGWIQLERSVPGRGGHSAPAYAHSQDKEYTVTSTSPSSRPISVVALPSAASSASIFSRSNAG